MTHEWRLRIANCSWECVNTLRQRTAVALVAVACLIPVKLVAEEPFLGRSADQWSNQFASAKGQQRAYAAWAIAQLDTSDANDAANQNRLESLNKLVQDGDPTVRYWGVFGLSRLAQRNNDDPSFQTKVSETLLPMLNDKSLAPRIAAAESLCLLGQTEKGLPVIVAAMADPQDSVRIQAVAALEKLGAKARPAIGTLEKATSDSSEYVKRISERSLTALGVEAKQAEPKARAKKGKAKAKAEP
jgi:HEAT repeat protein